MRTSKVQAKAAATVAVIVASVLAFGGVAAAQSQFTTPTAQEPPGIGSLFGLAGGWLLWAAGAAAVLTLMGTGVAVMIGRRNRSQGAADAMAHVPWVFLGGVLVTAAPLVAQAIL